jgi:putative oxidoreductase
VSEDRLRSALPVGLLTARLLVSAVFLIAGLAKVGAPGAFADTVREFHLIPASLVLPFAFIVPWLEILFGAYLVVGFMSRVGAAGIIVLLVCFEVALLGALLSGDIHHACGCFGSAGSGPIISFLAGGDTVTWWDVIRDLLLGAMAASVLAFGPGPWSLESALSPGHEARRAHGYSSRT